MSLAEDFENVSKFMPNHGLKCKLCTILTELSKEDAKIINAKVADMKITGEAISRILIKNGHEINANVVNRHRRKGCLRAD